NRSRRSSSRTGPSRSIRPISAATRSRQRCATRAASCWKRSSSRNWPDLGLSERFTGAALLTLVPRRDTGLARRLPPEVLTPPARDLYAAQDCPPVRDQDTLGSVFDHLRAGPGRNEPRRALSRDLSGCLGLGAVPRLHRRGVPRRREDPR